MFAPRMNRDSVGRSPLSAHLDSREIGLDHSNILNFSTDHEKVDTNIHLALKTLKSPKGIATDKKSFFNEESKSTFARQSRPLSPDINNNSGRRSDENHEKRKASFKNLKSIVSLRQGSMGSYNEELSKTLKQREKSSRLNSKRRSKVAIERMMMN